MGLVAVGTKLKGTSSQRSCESLRSRLSKSESRMQLTTRQSSESKPPAKLGKVMTAYAAQQGRQAGTLRYFTVEGTRVKEADIPAELNMEDDEASSASDIKEFSFKGLQSSVASRTHEICN